MDEENNAMIRVKISQKIQWDSSHELGYSIQTGGGITVFFPPCFQKTTLIVS